MSQNKHTRGDKNVSSRKTKFYKNKRKQKQSFRYEKKYRKVKKNLSSNLPPGSGNFDEKSQPEGVGQDNSLTQVTEIPKQNFTPKRRTQVNRPVRRQHPVINPIRPRNRRNHPPEVPVDPRQHMIIRHYFSKVKQEYLKSILPFIRFTFTNVEPAKPHSIMNTIRNMTESFVIGKYLNGKTVLDVGTCERTLSKLGAHSHGTEPILDLRTKVKMMRIEHMRTERTEDEWCIDHIDAIDNNTWCKNPAENCPHAPRNVALIVHVYSLKPSDIFKIIDRTTEKKGYMIYHPLKGKKGSIYFGEGTWKRKPNGEVSMLAEGNDTIYKHGNMDWLESPSFNVRINLPEDNQRRTASLVWRKSQFDTSGETLIVEFSAVWSEFRGKQKFSLYKETETKLDDVLIPLLNHWNDGRRINNYLKAVAKKEKEFLCGIKNEVGILTENIPCTIMSEAIAYAMKNRNVANSRNMVRNQIVRQVKAKRYREIGKADKLTNMVGALTQMAWNISAAILIQQETNSNGLRNKWNTYKVGLVFSQDFSIWRFLLMITLAVVVGVVFEFGVVMLAMAIFIAGFASCGQFKAVLVWWISFIGLMPSASAQQQDNHYQGYTSMWYSQFLGLVLLVLIFSCLLRTVRTEPDYSTWDNFKRNVEINRSTERVDTCAVRPLDGVNEINSKVDLNKYKIRPEVKLWLNDSEIKTRVTDENKLEILQHCHMEDNKVDRLGTLVIGPIFTTQYPLTFKISPVNDFISIYTRITCEVPYQCDKEYWEENCKRMKEHLPITKGNFDTDSNYKFPKPIDAKHDFDYATFDFYIKRFPKGNKLRIEKAKNDISIGNFSELNLCYNMFIKKEKQMICNYDEYTLTRPRGINGVSPHAKAESGLWFYNYSKIMKAVWGLDNWIWFCSGATTDDFTKWWEITDLAIADQQYLCSDFSKFDLTQSLPIIENETKWYQELGFTGYLSEMIINSKLKSTSYSKWFKFKLEGIRKTGDNDTSTGNSRITAFVIGGFFVKYCYYELYPKLIRMIVQGDDSFVALSEYAVKRIFGTAKAMLKLLKIHVKKCGFALKVMVTSKLMEAEFLSCKFLQCMDGSKIIGKKPGRVLCKIGHFLNNATRNREKWLEILKGTLISAIPTGINVPFLRTYIKIVLGYLQDVKMKKVWEDQYKLSGKIIEKDIDWEDFTNYYQLNLEDERNFERNLKNSIERFGLSVLIRSHNVDALVERELETDAKME